MIGCTVGFVSVARQQVALFRGMGGAVGGEGAYVVCGVAGEREEVDMVTLDVWQGEVRLSFGAFWLVVVGDTCRLDRLLGCVGRVVVVWSLMCGVCGRAGRATLMLVLVVCRLLVRSF